MIRTHYRNRTYPFLDGIRTVAMASVMMAHTYYIFHMDQHQGMVFALYTFIGSMGHMGVGIFYCLSGFLISGILLKSLARPVNVSRFYIYRWLKIFPTFLFIFVIASALGIAFDLYEHANIRRYGNTLLFLFTDRVHPLFTPIGTLRAEIYFYLFYPLFVTAVFFAMKKPKNRRLALLGLMMMVGAIGIAGRKALPDMELFQYFSLDAFALGCILKIVEPYYTRIHVSKPLAMFLTAAGCTALGLLVMDFHHIHQPAYARWSIFAWDQFVGTHLLFLCLFFLAFFRVQAWIWLLENPLMRWMGKVSYAFYLWHWPLVLIFLKWESLGPDYIRLIYAWIAVTVFAAGTTMTVEKYALSFRNRVP